MKKRAHQGIFDYLDLYFCHRADPDTPIGETVWAMHNLITQGKVLYWGTSEWTAEEITEAYEFADKNNLENTNTNTNIEKISNYKNIEKEIIPKWEKNGNKNLKKETALDYCSKIIRIHKKITLVLK